MDYFLELFSHYGFVFSLGLLSGITPCSIPTVMLIATYSVNNPNSVLEKLQTIFWLIMGMMLTLIGLAVIFSYIGSAFMGFHYPYILTSIIAIIMGLKLMGIIKLPLNAKLSIVPTGKRSNFISFLLGVPFTILGSPCSLPVLFTVLTYVLSQGTVTKGIPIIIAYGIGRAIPILLITILGTSTKVIFNSKFASSKVNFVLGMKLLFVGIYLLYQIL